MNETKLCKAAFSQADITPGYQTSLVGFYSPCSQGLLHKLYAQVLLFQAEDDYFCLVAIDNLGLTVQLAMTLRLKIAGILGTDVTHVMLNFSHTHSAPEPTPNGLNGERYFEFMCERITSCVEKAMTDFSPCKAGWALTTCNIGENRREGGSVTDKRLGALMIADAESGKPLAVVIRVAAHANVLKYFKVSSDYVGLAREELQLLYGCPVMIFQGAAGNLKPVGVDKLGGGSLDDLQRVADILVEAAKELRFEPRSIEAIRMFSRNMTFVADVPSKEEAERIAAEGGAEQAEEWLKECEELRGRGEMTQAIPAEVNFFQLDQGCFCGVADEIFCELAIDAQERTHNPLLFLNGYTNGCTGYLPSREEWHKGGFEVLYSYFFFYKYHGHVMPYRDDTADQIVDLVVKVLDEN